MVDRPQVAHLGQDDQDIFHAPTDQTGYSPWSPPHNYGSPEGGQMRGVREHCASLSPRRHRTTTVGVDGYCPPLMPCLAQVWRIGTSRRRAPGLCGRRCCLGGAVAGCTARTNGCMCGGRTMAPSHQAAPGYVPGFGAEWRGTIFPGQQQCTTGAPPHPNIPALGQGRHTLRVALEPSRATVGVRRSRPALPTDPFGYG